MLDEIEKAHPDVFNILLQVLDDGILTDGLGRRVDFKNTIIIMTSNIGTRDIKKVGRMGFDQKEDEGDDYQKMKETIEESLRRLFNPEFLNRVDDYIIFHKLTKEHINKIIDIKLKDLTKRLKDQGFKLVLTDAARSFLVDKGYDPVFGARPLNSSFEEISRRSCCRGYA